MNINKKIDKFSKLVGLLPCDWSKKNIWSSGFYTVSIHLDNEKIENIDNRFILEYLCGYNLIDDIHSDDVSRDIENQKRLIQPYNYGVISYFFESRRVNHKIDSIIYYGKK